MQEFWVEDKDSGPTFLKLYVKAPSGVIRSWFLEYIPACTIQIFILRNDIILFFEKRNISSVN